MSNKSLFIPVLMLIPSLLIAQADTIHPFLVKYEIGSNMELTSDYGDWSSGEDMRFDDCNCEEKLEAYLKSDTLHIVQGIKNRKIFFSGNDSTIRNHRYTSVEIIFKHSFLIRGRDASLMLEFGQRRKDDERRKWPLHLHLEGNGTIALKQHKWMGYELIEVKDAIDNYFNEGKFNKVTIRISPDQCSLFANEEFLGIMPFRGVSTEFYRYTFSNMSVVVSELCVDGYEEVVGK